MPDAITAFALLAGGTFAWATAALTPSSSITRSPELARPAQIVMLVRYRTSNSRSWAPHGKLL